LIHTEATPGTWRSVRCFSLLSQIWDNEAFVFNPASGHTHALNVEAWHLVETLNSEPMTDAQVLAFFDADTAEATDTIRASLGQLELFGLIERC
jgi:PqqD family protein of HPr-rel-A system